MVAENPASKDGFTLDGWDADNTARFEAVGSDRRSALEAALQATMTLLAGEPRLTADSGLQSAPISGEGNDFGALLSDLLHDLADQCLYFGDGWQNVSLNGIAKREDGGLVAWGYVSGTPQSVGAGQAIHLRDVPSVDESDPKRVVIRAILIRDK